jgi:hypothetical protein
MPSFDEMVKALNSDKEASENLSTDQKIDEIFCILKEAQAAEKAEGVEEQGEIFVPMGGGSSSSAPAVLPDSVALN